MSNEFDYKEYLKNNPLLEEASSEFDKLTSQAEEDYESGMGVEDVIAKIPNKYKKEVERHLRSKMGDFERN